VPTLPHGLSGREVRAALERAGFVFRRQRGSDMILRRDNPPARVVVPDHKEARLGTLRRLIADAGLNVEEFQELLRRQHRHRHQSRGAAYRGCGEHEFAKSRRN
jgi:predicted RNA binding protein YcfA (HicA-like mRNA interferase family)